MLRNQFKSQFAAWQQAEHEAQEAERRVYSAHRGLASRKSLAPAEIAEVEALQVRASRLLAAFLEDIRIRAASLRA
ncbi:hypothetical protein QTI33_08515 [Variovorax sp. J22P271]|uniref:hypothetical protein n=1 Tax=Variovorax davisae TaxID=3053515 RepID=UPI002575C236|nr:hypothetical protein [Variovorax sp. J22P271]MDM0032177.1 hypothetical protein [Variovorax sp. J22P271]